MTAQGKEFKKFEFKGRMVLLINIKKIRLKVIHILICGLLVLSILQSTTILSTTSFSLQNDQIEFSQASTQIIEYDPIKNINYGTDLSIVLVLNDYGTISDSLLMDLSNFVIEISTEIFNDCWSLLGFNSAGNLCIVIIATISLDKQRYQDGTKKDLPQNRVLIQEIIGRNPGISLRELQRKSGLGMGGIQYHIYQLESKIVESFKLGKCKHFFIASAKLSSQEKIWYSLNRNDNIRIILESLRETQNGCSQKDLTQYTGNSKSLISYYVKILKYHEIIEDHERVLTLSDEFNSIKSFEH